MFHKMTSECLMNSMIECYLVNCSKLMVLRGERIAHRVRTAEFEPPEDWQRKNEVYVQSCRLAL